jgi:hypothetical protein
MGFQLVAGSRVDSKIEDYTNWTVVDPSTDFTITASKIIIDDCLSATAAWLVYDLGADPAGWLGDFRAEFYFIPSASTISPIIMTLLAFSNADYTASYTYIDLAAKARMDMAWMYKQTTLHRPYIRNGWDGAQNTGSGGGASLTAGTTYYFRFQRRNNDTFVTVFTDAARTIVRTDIWAPSARNWTQMCDQQARWRYISTCGSYDTAGTGEFYGEIGDLKIWKDNSRITLGLMENNGAAHRLTKAGNRKMRGVGAGISHIK